MQAVMRIKARMGTRKHAIVMIIYYSVPEKNEGTRGQEFYIMAISKMSGWMSK